LVLDRIIVHGDAPAIAATVRVHLEAGADHTLRP
jgi:hypothetical protein